MENKQGPGQNSTSAAPWEFVGMAEASAILDVTALPPPPAAVGEERTCRVVFMEFMTKYFILFTGPESVSFWD